MSKIKRIRDVAQKATYQLPKGSLAESLVAPAAPAGKPSTLFDAVVAIAKPQTQRVSLMDQLVAKGNGDGAAQPVNLAQGALSLIENAPSPPPPARAPVPHVITFSGLSNSLGKVYRNPDEAIRASRTNARYMRNDLLVMECLEARQRATALLPWHIEPENPKDAGQNEAAAILTTLCERINRFTEYRRSLLEAVWYGREATQNIFGEKCINGEEWFTVTDWSPVNGDKLAFKWDGRVGIQVGHFGLPTGYLDENGNKSNEKRDYVNLKDRKAAIEMVGEYGRAYFLTEEERERTVIHKHMIEDGDFLDPISAGAIHGVGIRSRIYWTWFQKQSVLALLMEYLERSALGFDIWTFPWGNPQAEADMRAAAEQRVSGARNIVLVPVMPGQEGLFNYKHEEPGLEGARLINEVVHQFFQWQIKRYILGQILSTEPEGGGLGSSGLSDLHKDSLMSVVNYDCRNLEETLTEQLLTQLVKLNRHKLPESARNARFKFVIDSESPDIKESMEALEKAWNMNLPIAEKELYKVTGISAPDVDDKVLQGPSGGQQGPMGAEGGQEPEAPPANLLEQLAGLAKYVKDANGMEHAADGKFGSGGSDAAEPKPTSIKLGGRKLPVSFNEDGSTRIETDGDRRIITYIHDGSRRGYTTDLDGRNVQAFVIRGGKPEFSEVESQDAIDEAAAKASSDDVRKKLERRREFEKSVGHHVLSASKLASELVKSGVPAFKGGQRDRQSGIAVREIAGKKTHLQLAWQNTHGEDHDHHAKTEEIREFLERKGFTVDRPFADKAMLRIRKPVGQYSLDVVSRVLKAKYSLEVDMPEDCPDPTGYIAHEASHAIDNGLSDSAEWRESYQAEIADGRLTRYAATDRKEGFAEFGRLVVKNAKDAREQFPKCWGVWEQAGLVEVPKPATQAEATPDPVKYALEFADRVLMRSQAAQTAAVPVACDKFSRIDDAIRYGQRVLEPEIERGVKAHRIVQGVLARYEAPKSLEEKQRIFREAAGEVAIALDCRIDQAFDEYMNPRLFDEMRVVV